MKNTRKEEAPAISIHFNGLNGIRAICAIAVVISHSSLSMGFVELVPGPVFELAGYGVTAFFALSGFLITYLLMKEKNVNGDISIRKFYLRRLLRIWPLYFGYMLIAILADILLFNFDNFSSLGFYLFFLPNVPFAYSIVGMKTIIPIYLLGHFWSLGVEEQFYAFYPWLIKIFGSLLGVLISMFFTVVLIKLIAKFYSYKTGNPFWYSLADNTRFDAMALGGMGAWLYKYQFAIVRKLTSSVTVQISFTIIMLIILASLLKIPTALSHMMMAGITVLAIFYAHLLERPLINLRTRKIDYIGKISFGIYVYHPLAIGLVSLGLEAITMPELIKNVVLLISVFVVTLLLAALSFKYFEKYFLNLKFKYAVVKSKD